MHRFVHVDLSVLGRNSGPNFNKVKEKCPPSIRLPSFDAELPVATKDGLGIQLDGPRQDIDVLGLNVRWQSRGSNSQGMEIVRKGKIVCKERGLKSREECVYETKSRREAR
jgi:hypothetical protein